MDVKLVSATQVTQQKGLETWMQSWRMGQQFQGQVLSQSAGGNAVIRVGGHQLNAQAGFNLPVGAGVRFEVSSLLPQPQLKVVPETPLKADGPNLLGQQVRVLLPLQDNVSAPLARLLLSAESAKLLSLLGMGNDAEASLRALLPQLAQLADPAEVQALLQNSGAFATAAGVADLRQALLRLLQRIAELRAQQGVAQQLDGAELKSAERLLQSLGAELQGALATLTLNQLAMAQNPDRAAYMWLFDLPFQWRDRPGSLALKMARDREREQEEPEEDDEEQGSENWQVTLRLNLPTLGAIQVEILEQDGCLSLVLRAQRPASRQRLSDRLPQLQAALARRGLNVTTLRCYMGDYTPPARTGEWGGNVSESV